MTVIVTDLDQLKSIVESAVASAVRPMAKEYMTDVDVAEMLGITKRQVLNIRKKHGIPVYRIESSVRFKRSDIEAFLVENRE